MIWDNINIIIWHLQGHEYLLQRDEILNAMSHRYKNFIVACNLMGILVSKKLTATSLK